MPSNQRVLVKRVIEPGKRDYSFGLFAVGRDGVRRMIAIVEGTYKDAVDLSKSERTESGHSFKGFKRLKNDA